MQFRFISIAFLLFFAAGCGPSVTLSPKFEKLKPKYLALLPIKSAESLRDSRRIFFRRRLTAEFINRGYRFLDDSIISKICKDTSCKNRNDLLEYGVDGFVEATLQSSYQTDFGIGYYNAVTASLMFDAVDGGELALVEYTESERGGLVFQSGQLIQGLVEQYDNYGDDSFNRLSLRLISRLVKSLPKEVSRVGQYEARDEVSISSVETSKLKPNVYKICVDGTPNSLAFLVVYRNRSNLREISSGTYCGIFPLNQMLAKSLSVELRSVYGRPLRKQLQFQNKQIVMKGL